MSVQIALGGPLPNKVAVMKPQGTNRGRLYMGVVLKPHFPLLLHE